MPQNMTMAPLTGPLSFQRAARDRRLLARGQLPLGRADLPARQPAAARAAAARAHQAAPARPLGHDARAQLHLRPPQPADPRARPQRDLRRPAPATAARRSSPTPTWRAPTARSTRTSAHDDEGCGGCSASSRSRAASRATSRPETPGSIHEGGELGYCAAARLRRRVRQPRPARLLRGRRRRGGDRPARGELALEQVPRPRRTTARCCRSCTSTATRSPTRPCSPASRDDELRALLEGYGYAPRFVEGDDPATMHQLMAATLDEVARRDRRDPAQARARAAMRERPRWPMIVLRTPEGLDRARRSSTGCRPRARSARTRCRCADVRAQPRAPRAARGVDAQLPARGAVRRGRRAARRARRAARRRASGGWAPTRTPTAGCCCATSSCPTSATTPSRCPHPTATVSEATRVLGDVPARRDPREPRQLPRVRPRRDGLEPARRRLRGHRPRLGGRAARRATTTWRPTAA